MSSPTLAPYGHSRSRRSVVALAAGVALLAACGRGDAADAAASTTPSPSSTADVSPVPVPIPSDGCGTLTAMEAVHVRVGSVPAAPDGRAWSPADAETSTFDPCAPISAAVLPVVGFSDRTPYQVMIFHRGDYVGTALADARPGRPTVTRLTEDVLRVAFPVEDPAFGTATAVSFVAWDEATGAVETTGQYPSLSQPGQVEGDPPSGPIALVGEPYSGAGGPAPDGTQPPTALQDEGDGRLAAVLRSPSGNVGCALYEDGETYCGSDAMIESDLYGVAAIGAISVAGMHDGDMPALFPVSEAQEWQRGGEVQTLEYGQSVSYGPTVCTSEQTGMTCWDTRSGHGMFFNSTGWVAF